MIQDPNEAAVIRSDWATVRKIEKGLPSSDSSHISWGQPQNIPAPTESYNLPLVLAFAVLDKVFNALIAQSEFSCAGTKLGTKMHASRGTLPWQDFTVVDRGREDLNDLAHNAKLVDHEKCLEYVNAIEEELVEWGVVRPTGSRN